MGISFNLSDVWHLFIYEMKMKISHVIKIYTQLVNLSINDGIFDIFTK